MILYTTAANSLEVEREILSKLGDKYSKYKLDEVGKNEYSVVVIVEEVEQDANKI